MPALTDTEWRLLCVIVRQTLGWQQPAQVNGDKVGRKERDWLTQAQLTARTGRSSKPLSRAISGLVTQGFIQVLTDQGQALNTPEERRRYPDKHWYRLHPQWIASLAGKAGAAGQSTDAARNTSEESPYATAEEASAESIVASADNRSEACGRNIGKDFDEVCGLWPGEKVHTTKESSNKRIILSLNASVRETLTGSLTEEAEDRVLLSGKTPQVETPHGNEIPAETPHAPAPEMSAHLSLASESLGKPETTPAEPGYLRQLVRDDAVDYDEVRRFLLNYRDGYGRVFPQQELPAITWARDGRIVVDLLRRHSYAHLLQLLNRFLSHPDPRSRGYSLAAFSGAMDGLLTHEQQEKERLEADPRRPPSDTQFPVKLWRGRRDDRSR